MLAAGTPAEAIQIARSHPSPIHLLLTDVIMPGMNGRELAGRLQLQSPGLRCLFMSGYTANVIAHRGVLDDGVVFIQKPFSVRDLSRKVREALQDQA
jgi:FixJ family two-component response regulator